jgi:ABC-type uncharacterized transport system permease subunit
MLGENRKAAIHSNIPVSRITILVLLLSGGFAGLAGANDVLGVKGLFQAEWNPAYGFSAIPLVCLANLNGLAVFPLAYFFSFLIVGGELMSRAAGVPVFFVHVIEGLMFLFFAAGEYLRRQKQVRTDEFLVTFAKLSLCAEFGTSLRLHSFAPGGLGETYTERSGVLSLGIEGIMLSGAFCGFVVSSVHRSLFYGFLAGILTEALARFADWCSDHPPSSQ